MLFSLRARQALRAIGLGIHPRTKLYNNSSYIFENFNDFDHYDTDGSKIDNAVRYAVIYRDSTTRFPARDFSSVYLYRRSISDKFCSPKNLEKGENRLILTDSLSTIQAIQANKETLNHSDDS
jgi:hypothetical protein